MSTMCQTQNRFTLEPMEFGKRLRELRKQRGMTLLELATETDYDTGNLSRIERGVQGFSPELLEKLSKALNVRIADFFTEESNVEPALIGTRRIPVLDYIQAGKWTLVAGKRSESDIFEYLLTTLELSKDAFALRVRGDSMMPEFRENDYIIVDPAVAPRPGSFVVATNGDEEAVFKQYRVRGRNDQGQEVFELVPLNSFYPTLRSDQIPLRVIGTVVLHQRNLYAGKFPKQLTQ